MAVYGREYGVCGPLWQMAGHVALYGSLWQGYGVHGPLWQMAGRVALYGREYGTHGRISCSGVGEWGRAEDKTSQIPTVSPSAP